MMVLILEKIRIESSSAWCKASRSEEGRMIEDEIRTRNLWKKTRKKGKSGIERKE